MRKLCAIIFIIFDLTFLLFNLVNLVDNPYLVAESNTSQERKHIEQMVVMVGDRIDMKCQAAFTGLSDFVWKIDGKPANKECFPTNIIKYDLQINITAGTDGSTVSCEYARGPHGGIVKAKFHVLKDCKCNGFIDNVDGGECLSAKRWSLVVLCGQ